MCIEPAVAADLPAVRAVYADARRMQREQSESSWPEFPDASILAEIEAGYLFRIMDGAELVGVFSLMPEDPLLWGELECGEHLYLHRIARSAAYAGRGLVSAVLAWARERCRADRRAGLRMDTWASNDALIALYERYGFRRVGVRRIGEDPRLSPHYHDTEIVLLEERV